VLPVGATTPARVRVRFVGATHRDLEKRVGAGAFREDLLARLSGFTMRLPPLRERREDIGLLTSVLLRRIEEATGRAPSLSAEAGALLLRYRWPRNIRELEKCLERAVLFASDGPIEPWHLSPEARGTAVECVPSKARSPAARDVENRARLIELLQVHGGNLRMVADALQDVPLAGPPLATPLRDRRRPV
jgi:DNA-binding NtrC family response regulator